MQIKGRHIYHVGNVFLKEAARAWSHQKSAESIGQYAAARANGRGAGMVIELSGLATDLSLLPELGFPELHGESEALSAQSSVSKIYSIDI